MYIICTGSYLSEKLPISLNEGWCLYFNHSSLLTSAPVTTETPFKQVITDLLFFLLESLFSVPLQLDLSLGFDIINCFIYWLSPLLASGIPCFSLSSCFSSCSFSVWWFLFLYLVLEVLIVCLVHIPLSYLMYFPVWSHLFLWFQLPCTLLTAKPVNFNPDF